MLSKFRSGRAVLVCSLSAAAAVCLFFAVGFDTAKGQAVSTAGGLTAGTASVDFGDLTSGGSPEQTVTLSNTSAKDVTIQRIAAGSADFAVDPSATSCPRPGGIFRGREQLLHSVSIRAYGCRSQNCGSQDRQQRS